jgi:hypothetical protein
MILAAVLLCAAISVSVDSTRIPGPAVPTASAPTGGDSSRPGVATGALARAWDWTSRDFSVLMAASGNVDFATDIWGHPLGNDLPPGYRSDFYLWVDFFQWKGFISTWLIGNTTIMSRDDTTALRLSRIRYILTPGYRYEFGTWQIQGQMLHECIHTVSRPENDLGATWWNAFEIGAGSMGAYHDHLVDDYRAERGFSALKIDGQVNFGQFLYGERSIWIGQNHDFRQELFGTARLRLGSIGPFGFFQDVEPHFWRRATGDIVQKWTLSTHMYLLGKRNVAGVYFRWIPLDQSPIDNEDHLGQIGFEIVF